MENEKLVRLSDTVTICCDLFCGHPCKPDERDACGLVEAVQASIPAVDAVEVVRCQECEHWQKPFDAYPRGWCKKMFRWKERAGYCDEVQRREDGDA